jgi:uncharacterized protein (TIGR03435 family)
MQIAIISPMPPTIARRARRVNAHLRLIGAVLAITAGVAQPRTKTAVQPKFDVASVKRSNGCQDGGRSGDGGGGGSWSPGRLSLECRTVMNLLRIAYVEFADGKRRPPDRGAPIDGGPSWVNSDRYDIDAKADGAPGREMMSGPMMQTLLEDRFKVKIRREIRTVPVYELTVAKGGPKLQVAQEGKCINFDVNHPPPRPTPGQPHLPWCGSIGGSYTYGTTMAKLCLQLSIEFDQDVIDKTGIAGVFDIPFEWSPAELYSRASVDDGNPPVSATQTEPAESVRLADGRRSLAKVGLTLARAKGPGEFLVVDHVEKPSGN